MPIGVLINTSSILVGGLLGGLLGHHLSEELKTNLTMIFGMCSMGMGVYAIAPMKFMPPVIFAIVIGTALGLLLQVGTLIDKGAALMQRPIAKFFPSEQSQLTETEFTRTLVTIIVLFCASGTGIYGSLDSGMSGDHSILISKSILDFCKKLGHDIL